MRKKISDEIREFASKSGMSAHRMAIEAKLDRNVVYRFMEGENIRSDNLDALAELLELKIVKAKKR